jgi:hypothetical protein
VWRKGSLSCWSHGTYINIDLRGTYSVGEIHVSYNWRFLIMETCIGCDEHLQHMFPWVRCLLTFAAEALTRGGGGKGEYIFGGTPRAMSRDSMVKAQCMALIGCTWKFPY